MISRWGFCAPGIVAVVSFLMMSGYLMTLLIDRHYTDLSRIPVFYIDRAYRLFPQFLLYASRNRYCVCVTAFATALNRWRLPPDRLTSRLTIRKTAETL